MNLNNISGAIISRATLKELINSKDLEISRKDETLSFEFLLEHELIDEVSIDLSIGRIFQHSKEIQAFDLKGTYDKETYYEERIPDEKGGVIIYPNDFCLGTTLEKIKNPNTIIGILEEKRTSAGNLGLEIEGFVPPGLNFEQIRFTLHNRGSRQVKVYIDDVPPIKIIFYKLSSPEKYREGRVTRVLENQLYSSGTGLEKVDPNFVVNAMVHLPKLNVTVGKQLSATFTIENCTDSIIKSIQIHPIFNKNEYEITSCSPNWKVKKERIDIEQNKTFSFLNKKQKFEASSIFSIHNISPKETFKGTVGIKFNESMQTNFEFDAFCESEDGETMFIKKTGSFPVVTVEEKKKFYKSKTFLIILFVTILVIIGVIWPDFYNKLVEIIRLVIDFIKAI